MGSRMLRLSHSDLAAINARRSANKFGARKKQLDGITFDSTHESEVYVGLKIQQASALITDLQCHVPLRVEINGQFVFTYECDFVFKSRVAPWVLRYLDAKGYKKGSAYQLFRLKKAIIKASLGIEIEEV